MNELKFTPLEMIEALRKDIMNDLLNDDSVPEIDKDQIRLSALGFELRKQIFNIALDATVTEDPSKEKIRFIKAHFEVIKKTLDNAEKEIKKTFDKKPEPDYDSVADLVKDFPDGCYRVDKKTNGAVKVIRIKTVEDKSND